MYAGPSNERERDVSLFKLQTPGLAKERPLIEHQDREHASLQRPWMHIQVILVEQLTRPPDVPSDTLRDTLRLVSTYYLVLVQRYLVGHQDNENSTVST